MVGKTKVNSFLKMTLASVKKYAPEFFHRCPYVGLHVGVNVALSKETLTFYPIGTFRIKATFTDGVYDIFSYMEDFRMK